MNLWLIVLVLIMGFNANSNTMNKSKESDIGIINLLPPELKNLLVQYCVLNFINEKFIFDSQEPFYWDITSLANKTITLFPQAAQLNINLGKTDKAFYAFGNNETLIKYFKYYLTIKLSEINLTTRHQFLKYVEMHTENSPLIFMLMILSMQDTILESHSKFNKAYKFMKQALMQKALYFSRPLGIPHCNCSNFSYLNILNFDPPKFENTKLLKIFLNNNQDSTFFYNLIFFLKSDLKKELLDLAAEQPTFKKIYLTTSLAQAIWNNNLEEFKNSVTEKDITLPCSDAGFCPLTWAVICEAMDIIIYLLLNFDKTIQDIKTAELYAAATKSQKIINLFSTYKLLIPSILTNNQDLFRRSLKSSLKINKEILNNDYSLKKHYYLHQQLCIVYDRLPMFKTLIELTQPDEADFDNFFDLAIKYNSKTIAGYLIDKISSSWNVVTELPQLIAYIGDLPRMKLLINLGINVDVENYLGQTPLSVAKEEQLHDLVNVLANYILENNKQIEIKPKKNRIKKRKLKCEIS